MLHYYCRPCGQFTREHLLETRQHVDPFGTGDFHNVEIELRCPDCHGDDIEEMAPCDSCGSAVPLDGMDDCPACIFADRYSHTTNYDAGDHYDARRWLQANAPADLCAIEEIADRRREDVLEARQQVKQ